ncbi:MAG: hypothetical protein JEZ09_04505 [Salinivirgaceae bacterium]|nr:hypothetical protein [Salinivirgaceae bacterium]
MKYILIVSILVLSVTIASSQNVGQKGDTLVNYSDINGFKQGFWKKNYNDGTLKFEAYFVDDKPVGALKRYDKNGDLYAHLNYDEKGLHASAIFFHNNGKYAAIGKYYGQIKDSIWKYYDEKGQLYLQESYKIGIKHGQFKQLSSEGICIEETNYKEGIKHGPWIKNYTNGKLMWEANYVNGKLEGDAKAYFKNGKVYREGKYVNDYMEGGWLKYNETGNLEKVYQYKKGTSPESEKEKDEFMRKIEEGKDKYDGPSNANDLDWLRGGKR